MRAARTTWFWRLLAFYCTVAVAELSLMGMPNVLAVIVAVFTIEAVVLLRLTLSVTVALPTRVTLAATAWRESSRACPAE